MLFRSLTGIEVDILPGGQLDLPDAVLAELDWVVASAHGVRGQNREQLTASMVAAIEHPHVDVVAHPTGRLLDGREPYDVDVEALIAACARTGTFLEINANPKRLDGIPRRLSSPEYQRILTDYFASGDAVILHRRAADGLTPESLATVTSRPVLVTAPSLTVVGR